MNTATIRSRSVGAHDRLDAHFFTSPGVAALEQVTVLQAAGVVMARVGDIARVWAPPRFARAYAAPAEEGIEYLRPYDVFEYLPVATERLSLLRNEDLERLQPTPGTLLQTCSGRNLGPCTYTDDYLAQFTLSHDMIRIEVDDVDLRMYLLAFLKTPTGQALLRRGKSGSVIDHLTVADVAGVMVPLVAPHSRLRVTELMASGVQAVADGRERLSKLLAMQEERLPVPTRTRPPREGWTVRRGDVLGRMDAAFYDPCVAAAREQLRASSGIRCGDLAVAHLPLRYKRYYVGQEHGRPVLSGRQLLQFEPVNLRWVSDRSFRDPADYEISEGMTVFGAVGRSEGRQGTVALVTADRHGWLASNDVMRLRPRPGVRPGALWLALAARQSRMQINALSFGSVIDHMNPWDVESILVPQIEESAAEEAEAAWRAFSDGAVRIAEAVRVLESVLKS
ncbi:hypothetical protein ACFFX1_34530 [Dactylosporangium sucinum]|uniref:Restriction endonuclease subunit S n=1 Tax=Dactylosporangium sucinum TaxID=1424081 RepID=A0A917U1L0_9ACTN|nr:hypothetical protein [Dactylosporangium sucinum]GGM51058.1 hypothetical protein GCM10007977_061090 [Dactylosporangium sucinum]